MVAANPHMRFVGVDFNPEQIAHARSLVRRTGLSNISRKWLGGFMESLEKHTIRIDYAQHNISSLILY